MLRACSAQSSARSHESYKVSELTGTADCGTLFQECDIHAIYTCSFTRLHRPGQCRLQILSVATYRLPVPGAGEAAVLPAFGVLFQGQSRVYCSVKARHSGNCTGNLYGKQQVSLPSFPPERQLLTLAYSPPLCYSSHTAAMLLPSKQPPP